jgi:hypothetical protein
MSTTTIELAKSLLRKGRALGDLELITIANQMLEEVETPTLEAPVVQPKKKGRPRKAQVQEVVVSQESPGKRKKSIVEQFTIVKPQDKMKSVPVNKLPRINNWVDDGTESKDEVTPDFTPVKRERAKATKVPRICGIGPDKKKWGDEGCGQEVMVNPAYARDLFLCDACLLKKVKK